MGLIDGLWEGTKAITKKTLNTVDAISKADPQVVALVDRRLAEQDKWNDVFSTKLIEILDKIDAIRSEIRNRLEQIAAASQAQQNLLTAAEEYRAFSSEYEKINAALTLAQEKFVRAEGILSAADELKQRATEYSTAKSQLLEAQNAQEKACAAFDQARKDTLKVQEATADTLRRAEEFASKTESFREDSHRKLEVAQQALNAARGALGEASSMYVDAQKVAHGATIAHAAAASRLEAAEKTLIESSKQAASSALSHGKASEDLKRAEASMNANQHLLSKASAHEKEAYSAYKKATRQVRMSSAWALVSLVAAVSICVWCITWGISSVHYSFLAPILLTAFALCFGIYIWRKSE